MKKLAGLIVAFGALLLWSRGFSNPNRVVFTVSVQACARPQSGISLPELGALLAKRGRRVSSIDTAANCVYFEHIIEKKTLDGAEEGTERP